MDRANPRERDSVTLIRIFGANLPLCSNEDCGPGMSEEELTETVRLGAARQFGDRVRVEYHSLRDPETMKQYEPLLTRARSLGVPLPLVFVDDNILPGGGIDYRAIVNAIELKDETGG